MQVLLWIIFGMIVITVLSKVLHLGTEEGPRETKRWQDALDIVIDIPLLIVLVIAATRWV